MSRPSSKLTTPPAALLRHPDSEGWLAFERVRETVRADALAEVAPVLAAAQRAAEGGGWAVGFCCYEAASAFDEALTSGPLADLPLAWFALCDPPRTVSSADLPPGRDLTITDLRPTLTASEHAAGVERIRRWIARGDTYQVNYTHFLEATLEGDPWHLFRALERGQRSPYTAWLDIGTHAVCSASPELFFDLAGDRLLTRPMKGTAPRGRTVAEDRRQSARLAQSSKDRAENVMIVDMIRNDLGRIARPGSVETVRLCDIERYDTVFQMTSTIEARTAASAIEVLAALFPCASITGAPKVRTMELIGRLETAPRGLYTGAIGFIAPQRRARFSVAIRTATVARQNGALRYGTGGGIVWDSEPDREYSECADKARLLTAPRPDFKLLETLLWRPTGGFALLDRHLARLAESARYFDFAVAVRAVKERLEDAAARWRSAQRVRLIVDREGRAEIDNEPYSPTAQPLRLALAAEPVDSSDPFLFHKTTHRAVYEHASSGRPGADDVLLWNERGELTEASRANLVLEIEGRQYTPPITCGLLAGTQRAELLDSGEIEERILGLDALERCEAIYLINSVRGRLSAVLERSPSGD